MRKDLRRWCGGMIPGGGHPTLALFIIALLSLAGAAGCGSSVRTYAQEARSSYTSARAVLVGVEEYPAQMEELLRSKDISTVEEDAGQLIDDARELLPSASSAFRTAAEKADLLKGEGSDNFTPYAEILLELTGLNEQVISAYSEYIGLCGSVLGGLPYGQDPEALMPTLTYMDEVIVRLQELGTQIDLLEEGAETLYLELTK